MLIVPINNLHYISTFDEIALGNGFK